MLCSLFTAKALYSKSLINRWNNNIFSFKSSLHLFCIFLWRFTFFFTQNILHLLNHTNKNVCFSLLEGYTTLNMLYMVHVIVFLKNFFIGIENRFCKWFCTLLTWGRFFSTSLVLDYLWSNVANWMTCFLNMQNLVLL